jgi:hypothetical protein
LISGACISMCRFILSYSVSVAFIVVVRRRKGNLRRHRKYLICSILGAESSLPAVTIRWSEL